MITLLRETGEFRRVAEVLFLRGWAEASAGNLSLRLTGRLPAAIDVPAPGARRVVKAGVNMSGLIGDRFLVTASGSRMRDIAVDPENGLCLIQVLDRRRYWIIAGSGQPSSEWAAHGGLHSLFKKSRRPERAVVHCHPLSLIALSHLFTSEREMNDHVFRMQHETRLFVPEMIGLVPYAVTGSNGLAKATREKLKKCRLAVWDKHGVIASGRTLGQALDRIEMVEKAAAIYLQLKSAGLEPKGLSDKQIAATLRAFKK